MIAWSDEQIDPLAPARGIVRGVLAAVVCFWAPVAAFIWFR